MAGKRPMARTVLLERGMATLLCGTLEPRMKHHITLASQVIENLHAVSSLLDMARHNTSH